MISFWVFKKIIIAIGLASVALLSYGLQSQTSEPDAFPQCIERLQQQARDAGVSDNTIINILGYVRPLPKILSYDRNQPEFVQTFTGYFSKRVTNWRVNKGREKLVEHREFLSALTQQYGVPAYYPVSYTHWTLPTNRHV